MIKIEHVETAGWEAAFRGMRNPMNSWAKGDSRSCDGKCPDCDYQSMFPCPFEDTRLEIGPNDQDLAMRLRNAGDEHRKFMRMICIWCDITAPLYWWKQFDTYKIGTVANSCSTMHKIHAKEFTLEDFSFTGIPDNKDVLGLNAMLAKEAMISTIETLNVYRNQFIKTEDKCYWNAMVELLPNSYNQKRTVMLNYEVAAKQYRERRHHKLQEWHDWCDFLKTLPASELITGEE